MLSTKDSVMSYHPIGSVALQSCCPDLLGYLGTNDLDLDLAEPDRTPKIGFRIGLANDDSGANRDAVVVDVCQPEIAGNGEERTKILRFQLSRHQAAALAALILSAVH